MSQKTFYEIAEKRFSRRTFLYGAGWLGASALIPARAFAGSNEFQGFKELPHRLVTNHEVPKGFESEVLIRWGDPVVKGARPFDIHNQTPENQDKLFGYNNDYTTFMPLPFGSENAEHGLLCVNHENTTGAGLMFPERSRGSFTKNEAAVQLAAHGHSVVEIRKLNGKWQVIHGDFNRRISAYSTEHIMSGPGAGHDRMKTSYDSTGHRVIGTLGNCAGGHTPWGTVLIAEENVDGYFGGNPNGTKEEDNYKRMGIRAGKKPFYPWYAKHFDRFNIDKELNELNRFGWIVEYDPYNPLSVPVKRTALGRFKHEGADMTIASDGRLVVYSGDDQSFQYIYKFVSDKTYNPDDRGANFDILDSGILYVARFEENGTVKWLPLVFNQGPLSPANGFDSQADVMIETRRAAKLLGATPMDRPEDIETNPVNKHTYVVMTKNKGRKQTNPANPRAHNKFGHIVEMIPPKDAMGMINHAADEFSWDMFLMGGNPFDKSHEAMYQNTVSKHGWLSNPDNIAFDGKGRIWISTDGQQNLGFSDGVYMAETEGKYKGATRHFMNAPKGAELTGPSFTPDSSTLFVSVQHPGIRWKSTFKNPATRWPDFDPNMPPRPAVVAIRSEKGGSLI